MEQIFSLIMIVTLVANYLFIAYGLLFKKGENNFATWILWTIFDVVGLYGTLKNNEDPLLTATFVAGSGVIAIILLLKRNISWTWVETGTTILVIACIITTQIASPAMVINATATGLFIAGVPYLKDLWKKPTVSPDELFSAQLFTTSLFFGVCSTFLRGELITIPFGGFLYWVIGLLFIYRSKIQ